MYYSNKANKRCNKNVITRFKLFQGKYLCHSVLTLSLKGILKGDGSQGCLGVPRHSVAPPSHRGSSSIATDIDFALAYALSQPW